MSNPQSSEKKTKAGTAAASPQTKRARADANEAEQEAKKFKKAKPSICKAAEELVCPILQGLPIDPVVAEDVSQGVCLCCCAYPFLILNQSHYGIRSAHITYMLQCVYTLCDFRVKFTRRRRLRST